MFELKESDAENIPQYAFLLKNGGIGDYLNYLSALYFVADNYPSIDATVFCPDYFVETATNVLKSFQHDGNWAVYDGRQFEKIMSGRVELKHPTMLPVNPVNSHLMDLGFMYFADHNPPPAEYNFFRSLNLDHIKLHGSVKNLGKYAVMTPGYTAPSRKMPAHTFNAIKDHIISLGIKPVFLGSKMKDILNEKNEAYAKFEQSYDLSGGLNLLNKTSLLEAAKVIDGSEFIVGLDNGLLHLGAMTKAPIVFGYTIAGPKQRRPRRRSGGPIIDVTVSTEDLGCIHCQEKIRFVQKHDFKYCYYGHYKCLDLLNAEKYINGINEVLNAH